jgi:PAS domain S-box-containing protein
MSWLSDLPVQRKLGYAMLLTSMMASVLACAVFLAVEYHGYRENIEHTVATLARISAENSTATIAFSDPIAARQNLEALRAEPQIIAATLYSANGKIFARFAARPEEMLPADPTTPLGVHFEKGYVIAAHPVVEGSRRLGTLHLQATMEHIYQRMRNYSVIVLGVLGACFGLAGLIASILRRTLARPILELAGTAGAVSLRQDYSLRARQYGQDELGQLTATFNAMLDRTQAAVDGLRESEWAHRELVRSLPTAAYMCDARGMITIFNDAAVLLWGRVPAIGREHWCGSHRMYRPDGTEVPPDQSLIAVALREGRAVRGEEIIIERPDGTRRNVLANPEPIRDTAGTIVGIVNMLVDITEQKRAGAAVRQLAAIVESSDDAIIGRDLEGFITAWNGGAERLYGYTATEVIGRHINLLLPLGLEAEEPANLNRIRNIERIEHYETVRRRKDGSLLDVSLTVSPIKDEHGQIIGASKIARDITGRKRAQQQADFLSQLSQMLSAVSDPDELIQTASREIGLQLQVDRCYFAMISNNATLITVREDWARKDFLPLSGTHHIRDFGTPDLWRALSESPVAVDDTKTHVLTRDQGGGYGSLRIRAHATVPFLREGEWVASLTVATEQPRTWHADEMSLLENALGRVWPMIERARSQRELEESERRQRDLMRALPIPCYTIDTAGRLTFFNEAAVGLWGQIPPASSVWQGAVVMTDLEGKPMGREQYPDFIALKEERPVRGIEAYVVRPDGSRRWVVPHPEPIFDAQGGCTGVLNVVMDVTEERTAHQQVQKVAERLSLAIASANLGDWKWDATTDLIILSPRTAEIYGIQNRPGLTRSDLRDLLHPDDRERARQELKRSIDSHTDYDIEYRVTRPDGTVCWVAAKGRSLLTPDGRVQGMVGVVQDITERKQHAEILRENEAQLRLVTDNAPVLLVRTDRHDRYTFVNRAYAERHGFQPSQMIGMSVRDAVGPEAYAGFKPHMDEALEGARVEFEMEVSHDRLGRRWIHVIYVPEKDANGRVTGLLGVITDIGARKEAEIELKRARDEAIAASRAKDDFLAALSHELRTPLNPVLLLASAAANNPELPATVRTDFDLILKNVHLEARLIDDLLDLTRITRNKLHLEQRPCIVHTILEDAIANVEAELVEKKLSLEVDFGASSSRVKGDSVRLQQVFWNILKNAVKFTPEGGRITVRTTLANDGETLVLRIADTGTGMTPEELGRVFQAFTQGDHAATTPGVHRFGGLGLGLAISKKLVELHSGRIQAFSEGRDLGSVFQVDLPVSRGGTVSPYPTISTGRSISPSSSQVANPSGAQGRRRILLVEDHAPTRQTLQHLLRQRNFEVASAESAANGLQLALDGEFDLIISDVGLPDRNGYELMTELRALRPQLVGIALSGYGMEQDLNRSRAAGFSAHLVKPVTIGMIEDAIASLTVSSASQAAHPPQP